MNGKRYRTTDRERLAGVVADAARRYLHSNDLHAVVLLDDSARPWSPGSVFHRRSNAQRQATRFADEGRGLAYVVSRHADALTVWAGPDTILLTDEMVERAARAGEHDVS